MITLEQVEQLDDKVKKAVRLIEALRLENARLQKDRHQLEGEVALLQERLEASSSKAGALEGAQQMVERGIMHAIGLLSEVDRASEEDEKEVLNEHQSDNGYRMGSDDRSHQSSSSSEADANLDIY